MFSLSYDINKQSGSVADPSSNSTLLTLTEAGGSEEAGNFSSYSFVLGDLFPFTEYQFNLSAVYGDTDSDPVMASNTTDDDGKKEGEGRGERKR